MTWLRADGPTPRSAAARRKLWCRATARKASSAARPGRDINELILIVPGTGKATQIHRTRNGVRSTRSDLEPRTANH